MLSQLCRRPYGEGQLEPDVEHQDAKEEPGEKGKEQKRQEENRSVTLSARQTDFAADPDMQQDRRPHSIRPPWPGNLEQPGVVRSLLEIVGGLDRIPCQVIPRNLISQSSPPVENALREKWSDARQGFKTGEGGRNRKGPQVLPVQEALDRSPRDSMQSFYFLPA